MLFKTRSFCVDLYGTMIRNNNNNNDILISTQEEKFDKVLFFSGISLASLFVVVRNVDNTVKARAAKVEKDLTAEKK